MSGVPETPRECSICNRVEQALMNEKGLKERLSEKEFAELVQKIQYAIHNKNEMNKNIGGTNMSDEKYVISKASFEDFYETQDNIVSIIEKMVNRIEKQDQVIMKFGAALADLLADDSGSEDAPVDEDEDLIEEDVEMGGDEAEPVVDEMVEEDEPVGDEVGMDEEEGVPAEGEFADEGHGDVDLQNLLGKAQKAAFEAGWKAHEAELKKQNGIPVTVSEAPVGANRPVSTADAAAAGQMKKTLTDDQLGKMSPQQINQWLKEQGF